PALGWGAVVAFHFLRILLASLKNVSRKWRGFLAHLGSYVIIISMLGMINLFTFADSQSLWFQWPALGWGVVLALHFLRISLFGAKGVEGRQQEQSEQRSQPEEAESSAGVATTRRRREAQPRRVEYPLIKKGQTNSTTQAHLDRALAYHTQIDSLIKATPDASARARLQDLAVQVDEWVEAIEDLVRRIDDIQQNNLIRQDLEAVPQAIANLETRLAQESDPDIQAQLERTLSNRKNQLASLERLQTMMKRAEIQIESTLSSLGTIYSQLLTGQSTDHVADYSRLSSEVDEEVRLLQDRLEALEEVKLSRT
ncbi:MAG TPA: 2TM domain-containing protein, partial [Anaerolineae bacterium]|nr:2TM domain-containing protein [Anaerolineae bacterium]